MKAPGLLVVVLLMWSSQPASLLGGPSRQPAVRESDQRPLGRQESLPGRPARGMQRRQVIEMRWVLGGL